jgi:hypothetical protein
MNRLESVRCKDCKHSFRSWLDLPTWGSGYEYRCRQSWIEPKTEFDPVQGLQKIKGKFESCQLARMKHNKLCGPEGKRWEPKDSKNFFTYLKRV